MRSHHNHGGPAGFAAGVFESLRVPLDAAWRVGWLERSPRNTPVQAPPADKVAEPGAAAAAPPPPPGRRSTGRLPSLSTFAGKRALPACCLLPALPSEMLLLLPSLPPLSPPTRMRPWPVSTCAGVAWLPAGFLAVVFGLLAALLLLPRPWNWAVLALNAASLLVPLRTPPPRWATRFLRFSVAESRRCECGPLWKGGMKAAGGPLGQGRRSRQAAGLPAAATVAAAALRRRRPASLAAP